jgi:uncharacterized membrane protein YbjE (DUF340 family)
MKEIIITIIIFVCIVSGIFIGYSGIISSDFISQIDSLAWWLLELMIFLVGIDLGLNHIGKKVKETGWRLVILPIAVIIASLLAGVAAALVLMMPIMRGVALSGGLGWYTLTAILFNQWKGPEMGAMAFLTNVFREMLTMLLFPILHRMKLTVSGIAMGGATTMDTSLVLINRVAGPHYAALAFVQGFVCTLIVPFMVTFLAGFM